MFERTWQAAIEICQKGMVQGTCYSAGATLYAPPSSASVSSAAPAAVFAIRDREGQVLFVPSPSDEEEFAPLFAVARRFAELEDAHERGVEPPPYIEEPRRTALDSLREWGLLDEKGNVIKAYEHDPEPLLGYVVRVGSIYAYGVVKQSVLSAGTITPTGACESPDEARRRASELLMLALVRGATVMGMNGIPAVIDLSAEPEEG